MTEINKIIEDKDKSYYTPFSKFYTFTGQQFNEYVIGCLDKHLFISFYRNARK